MFNNSYISRSIDWVQAQPQRLGLPRLTQGTTTALDDTEESGSESAHSGELIEWNESPFCQIKMQKFENQMLQHRIHELQKQLESLCGGTAAVTRGFAQLSRDSGIAAFDELVIGLGLISDISTPIRAVFLNEVHCRRKAETEVVNLRRDRALAIDECSMAWKKMEEMMKTRPGSGGDTSSRVVSRGKTSTSRKRSWEEGRCHDGNFAAPNNQQLQADRDCLASWERKMGQLDAELRDLNIGHE